ncbi:MAG: AMP-binding protein [Acidimicrobiaceae bacterium]|nr:AMP-binding protein [Acidimicrobiaceae bacterium]
MGLDKLLSGAPARDVLVLDASGRFSSADVEDRVRAVAAALEVRGIGPGDRVAFRLPVGVDSVVAYRACWRIGAVAVALHPAAGSHDLKQALALTGPAVTITARELPPVPGVDAVGLDELTAAASDTTTRRYCEPAADGADAVVMFTSGSTGAARGVIHTHGSLAYKIAQLTEAHGLTPDDCALVPSPLAHVAGLLHGVLMPGAAGMKTVLMPRWYPEAALALIEQESVTYMVGPPTLFTTLMDCDGFDPARTATLRMISCGGAGVTPAFCRRAAATLGVVVKRSYGSTEAPTIATSRFDDPTDKMILTDGRAFGDARLRVADDGELWVSGPEVARGYLDPADTRTAFVDGWFRTGDLATVEDGWVTVTGRLGDRIIRSGENISATEVEQHLEAHPAVLAAAAVAEPDDRLGERVAAFVVAPDGFDLTACREWFARRGAARFITPERIEVVEELPVLASGKVDRMKLQVRLMDPSGSSAGSDR